MREVGLIEEVEILLTFVFVGHRYVQHAHKECPGEYCTRYQNYSILENHELPDAIAFAYEYSTHLGSAKAAVSLESGVAKKEGYSEEDALMGEESNKSFDSEKRKWDSLRSY